MLIHIHTCMYIRINKGNYFSIFHWLLMSQEPLNDFLNLLLFQYIEYYYKSIDSSYTIYRIYTWMRLYICISIYGRNIKKKNC